MFYSPLKHSIYRAVWLVLFFSNIGTWIQTTTSSIFIAKLTDSPALIALVQAAAMMPIFIIAIPAGIIADSYDRRIIVVWAQIAMAAIAFAMAVISFLGKMSPWLLISMTFLLNMGLAFNQPAWQAVSSMLVPREDIKQAAVLNNLSYNVSRCIGPAIAGFFFASLGSAWLFLLNGISFLGVIWIFGWKVPSTQNETGKYSLQQLYQSFKQSLLFFQQFPLLKFIALKSFCYFLLATCVWALLPYIVFFHNHMQDKQLGLFTTAAGIGAVMNAYGVYYLRKFLNDNELTTLSLLLAALVLFLIGKNYPFIVQFILMVIFGFSWAVSVSVFNGLLQSEFPATTRSRLIGIYCIFFAGSQAVGSYLSGILVRAVGLSSTLMSIAAIAVVAFAVYFVRPHFLWCKTTEE